MNDTMTSIGISPVVDVPDTKIADVAWHPVDSRASFLGRWQTMARVGLRMAFHDRMKFAAALIGVVFAVLLSNQQAATFLAIVNRNVMVVDNNPDVDIWITPPETEILQAGKLISQAPLNQARGMPGVAWAEPMLIGAATVSRPEGGSEQAVLIGTRGPAWKGGPFNMVAGAVEALAEPDSMIFEDSDREKFGGLNLGSVREVNGRRIKVVGFTWGLVPFGPSTYAFAEFDLARQLMHTDADQSSVILVGLKPGVDAATVARDLQKRMGTEQVSTRDEFRHTLVHYMLTKTPIGVVLGSSTVIGLLVGFIMVSLTMFSAVLDNLREFGTLKALGATTLDLVGLLWVQAIVYGAIGAVIGSVLVGGVSSATRSAQIAMQLPPVLLLSVAAIALVMCIVASSLAVLRVRAIEPAMVFR
jgi:putative ABC transport system permease protein